jgi:uncharacterized protein YacL (UPF0231 family)
MDYEFLRDITGVVKVRMSMDHEAIGHWFNEEVKGSAGRSGAGCAHREGQRAFLAACRA